MTRDNRVFDKVEYVCCSCCGKEIPEHYRDEYHDAPEGVTCLDCANACPCVEFQNGQCVDCGSNQTLYDAG